MSDSFTARIADELDRIRADGLWKDERVITSPQSGRIDAEPGGSVLNFCANNYLGLADHPALVAAAHDALDRYGYGMASVRFICGTQDVHKELEARLAGFLGMDDAILYGSCFDANGGLFETLLGDEDAIISDALNHASIIDGVRLCKARRYRYANNDMAELERCLTEAADARARLIATDGVFSMDGIIADLAGDLRPRREARRPGHGRRQPRHRLRRRPRPRLPRALRRRGPHRHPHRHPRQGARRRLRRLHRRPPRGRRAAAPALPPLPLLQHAVPAHRRRLARRPRPDRRRRRPPRPPRRQRRHASAPR